MQQIFSFIEKQPAPQQQLLGQLRDLILGAAPRVEEALKWKIPFYSCHGLLCYLNPQPGHVVLGFCRGAQLSNEQGLLSGSGKEVRLLMLSPTAPLPVAEIRQLLQEAILLNETMQRRKNYYV